MVHQHFMLADNLTVLENTVLGAETLHGIGGAARKKIKELSDAYRLGIRPDVLVEDLGVADRQRVEILKVLYRGARTLILDEPTAVLVPQEVDALFENLRELKAEGLTVLFISHKLGEVLSVADDITVVRRGTTVASVKPEETTPKQLAELMVGSELPSPETRESTVTDARRCSASTGCGCRPPTPTARCGPCSTASSSRSTRAKSWAWRASRATDRPNSSRPSWGCACPTPAPSLSTAPTSPSHSTRERREGGIGYIPEDRHRHGLLLEGTLWENRILGHVTEAPNSKGQLLDVQGRAWTPPASSPSTTSVHPASRSPRLRSPAATSRS